jgi:hypothetical protein
MPAVLGFSERTFVLGYLASGAMPCIRAYISQHREKLQEHGEQVTPLTRPACSEPQDRQGRFSSEPFERYQRSEKALVGALAEMDIQGVSTRKVKAITEELCGHEFSASADQRHQ